MGKRRMPGPALVQPARFIADPTVRRWLYGIAVAAVPLLIAGGVLTEGTAGHVLTLIAAILAPAGLGLAAANTPRGEG